MIRSLLVVSDNPLLSKWLQTELRSRYSEDPLQVEWRFSKRNTDPGEMISLGATSLDVGDQKCVSAIVENFDLVLSVHCKQIFPLDLVEGTVCVNVHPGFNPFNRGWFPQVFSILNGLPIGATIHLMDTQVDHGPIIDQEMVAVDPGDTSLEVYEKVMLLEKKLLSKNLDRLLTLSFDRRQPTKTGNLNSLADFRELCKLDLEDVATFREHLAILRALSHGEFRNGYFVEGNKKYFVRILIARDEETASIAP